MCFTVCGWIRVDREHFLRTTWNPSLMANKATEYARLVACIGVARAVGREFKHFLGGIVRTESLPGISGFQFYW